MIADNVHNRRMGLAPVVQIGDSIAQPRAQMQKRRRRFAGHACITVCATGRDTLKQAQDRVHLRHGIQGGHKVHLRRARIHEAGIYTTLE